MKFTFYEKEYNLSFVTDIYTEDETTYVGAGDSTEPFADITVCVPFGCQMEDDEILLDTNNSSELINEMIRQGYLELTDKTAESGYCIYPVGKMTDKLKGEIIYE